MPTDTENFERIRELLDEIRNRLDAIERQVKPLAQEAPCPRSGT